MTTPAPAWFDRALAVPFTDNEVVVDGATTPSPTEPGGEGPGMAV